MRTKELVAFIKERQRIFIAKETGKRRPWTKDPILEKYRFCNVHREDDRVTRWLRDHWYPNFTGNPDMWFTAIVARLFNQPDALEAIRPYVLPWKPERIREILHKRKEAKLRNFNAAYIVSTNGIAMEKVDYIVLRVLGPIWAARQRMRPKVDDTLATYHILLTQFDGLGSFIAAQVVADLKYLDGCPLSTADDWWTFAASGPGSRRGLNRVLGFPLNKNLPEFGWRAHLNDLLKNVNKMLTGYDWAPFHAQDLQNCLCEFDKYERARLGEGEPKQLYKERSE